MSNDELDASQLDEYLSSQSELDERESFSILQIYAIAIFWAVADWANFCSSLKDGMVKNLEFHGSFCHDQ